MDIEWFYPNSPTPRELGETSPNVTEQYEWLNPNSLTFQLGELGDRPFNFDFAEQEEPLSPASREIQNFLDEMCAPISTPPTEYTDTEWV